MSDVLISVLSLSLSGSVMALILLALKPLLTKKLPKAFWYYVWLLVLLRLVVPVTLPVNVMDSLFRSRQPDFTYTASISDDTQTEAAMVQQTVSAAAGTAQSSNNTQLTAGETGGCGHFSGLKTRKMPLFIIMTPILCF